MPEPTSTVVTADQGKQDIADDVMCLTCGYNLRGLSRASDCPECGFRIIRTLMARQGMTQRELATLAFRVASLWYLLKVLFEILQGWRYLFGDWLQQGLTLLMAGVVIGLLAITWWKAEVLARLAIRNDGPVSLSGRILPSQIMSVALGIIGVLYIIYGVTGAIWILMSILIDMNNEYMSTSLVNSVLNLFTGCVILFGATRIARFVMRLRTTGTKQN